MITAPSGDIRLRLSTGVIGALGMTSVAMVVSLVSQTALARTHGAAGLGLYQATSLFVIVMATVLTLGLPLAVSQRVGHANELRGHDDEHVVAAAAAITLPLALLAGVAAFLIWPAIASRLGANVAVAELAVGMAVVASVVHSLVVSLLIARLHMGIATGVVLIQPASVLLAVIATDLDGSTLAVLGFISAGGLATAFLLARGSVVSPQMAEVAALLRRSAGATSVLHATLLSQWFERAVVAVLVGPLGLGAFAGASLAAEVVQRLPRSLGGFGVAAYARLEQDPPSVSRVLGSHVRVLSALYIVAGTGLVAAGPELLTLVFGPEFGFARTTVRLLGIALVPGGIALALASAAAGTHVRGTGRIAGMTAILHLVVVVASTAVFSIAGTAFAQIVTWSLATILYRSTLPWQDRTELDHALRRTAGVAVPSWTLAWIMGVGPIHPAVAAASAIAVSATMVSLFILREPDRRLLVLVAQQVRGYNSGRG